MSVPSDKQSIRAVVVALFPFLAGFVTEVSARGRGLAIRAAGGLLHLAGGASDPAVHRVGDLGTAGTLMPFIPGGGTSLQYEGPDGTVWQLIGTCASPGSPVVWGLTPITGTAGKIVSKAETGSEKVTCGG